MDSEMAQSLPDSLLHYQHSFKEVVRGLHDTENLVKVDMSKDNQELMSLDIGDTLLFTRWMEAQLNGKIGWGGYLEHREMYRRSRHFDGQGEPRSLHLGIDVWTVEGTAVCCPINGVIDSFADNQGFGNYGPTIILKHELEGHQFYTLYGHLNRSCLATLAAGQEVRAGDQLGILGNNEENGSWPPHLHFQLMNELMGNKGDFPGVAAMSEKKKYQAICPDPNLVLKCM